MNESRALCQPPDKQLQRTVIRHHVRRALTTAPPRELWPSIVRRVELPEDVELQPVPPIEAHRAQISTRGA